MSSQPQTAASAPAHSDRPHVATTFTAEEVAAFKQRYLLDEKTYRMVVEASSWLVKGQKMSQMAMCLRAKAVYTYVRDKAKHHPKVVQLLDLSKHMGFALIRDVHVQACLALIFRNELHPYYELPRLHKCAHLCAEQGLASEMVCDMKPPSLMGDQYTLALWTELLFKLYRETLKDVVKKSEMNDELKEKLREHHEHNVTLAKWVGATLLFRETLEDGDKGRLLPLFDSKEGRESLKVLDRARDVVLPQKRQRTGGKAAAAPWPILREEARVIVPLEDRVRPPPLSHEGSILYFTMGHTTPLKEHECEGHVAPFNC